MSLGVLHLREKKMNRRVFAVAKHVLETVDARRVLPRSHYKTYSNTPSDNDSVATFLTVGGYESVLKASEGSLGCCREATVRNY